ncbi:MAG: DUF2796 domain-containing protein [Sphingobacteriia bacterium]|nr:DUF2796 domain-containing protein [Sphingobacteriia bacterium]NCC39206.1 DUF2796 domain-containing protein [Gammaproteobacteria bacterium]
MNSIRVRHLAAVTLAGVLGSSMLLVAAEAPRQSGAHVHGMAHLNIAIAGAQVLVELTSPAATMVGFERAPRTQEERETLALARENLLAGDAMIRFSTRAACRLLNVELDTDLAAHGHDHDHHDGDERHADLHVSYRFECDQPAALDSAALGLFAGFPALERVLVQYVMDEGQGGAELTPGQPVVSFVPF